MDQKNKICGKRLNSPCAEECSRIRKRCRTMGCSFHSQLESLGYKLPLAIKQELSDLREKRLLCDGILISNDGTRFHIHCIVIASSTPHFLEMINQQSTCINASSPRVIRTSYTSEDIVLLLDYLYTNQCQLTDSNVRTVILVADQLQLHSFVEYCSRYLINNLSSRNCIILARFANEHGFYTVENAAINKFLQEFDSISKSREFLESTSTELQRVLSEDELNVVNEEEVFFAVAKWAEHSLIGRFNEFLDLLKSVRFGLTSLEFLHDKVLTHNLVLNNKVRKIIQTAVG